MKIKRSSVFIFLIVLVLGLISCSCAKKDSSDPTSTQNPAGSQIDNNKEGKIDSGLLLGLSTAEKDSNNRASSYRTLWITSQDGSIKVAETPKIIVPYGQDWWIIERAQYSDEKQPEYASNSNAKNTVVINDLISYPANKSYSNSESIKKYTQTLLPDYQAVEEDRKIVFVGNKYVSILSDFYYNTGGTLRPYFRDAYVVEINTINRNFAYVNPEVSLCPSSSDIKELKKVAVSHIIGNEVSSYIEKYKNTDINENEQGLYGSSPEIKNTSDEYGWSMIRKDSRWVPQVAKKWSFSNASTYSEGLTLFDLPLSIPESVTSFNDLYPDWNSIKKSIPEAFDAVSSPTKDMLVVLTSDKLLIYTNPLEDMSEPASSVKLNNENLIMAQWATGEYVQKCDAELSGILK